MFTQTKKKIYIIGSNPKDFFDLTIESTKILSKSDLIIFSKSFSRKYTNILNYNTKNILYEEDLGSSKQALWKKICELFNNHKIISHLIVGDPYLFFENDQEEFFLKKKIIVEKILGIPEIVNAINKKKILSDE